MGDFYKAEIEHICEFHGSCPETIWKFLQDNKGKIDFVRFHQHTGLGQIWYTIDYSFPYGLFNENRTKKHEAWEDRKVHYVEVTKGVSGNHTLISKIKEFK